MLSCFNGKMRITQKFSNVLIINGKEYYRQFGMVGHNGLDLVSINSDRRLFNFFPGKILKMKYSGAYGNRIVIWNEETKLTEAHNHLASFSKDLTVGQYIEKKTFMGVMGQSGKVFGAHNHFEIRETNEKGYIINIDNGYKGGVDPLKYIHT